MNHKNRSEIFRRKGSRRINSQKCIVFAEGQNTEKSYLDLLKRGNCKIIPITKRGHGIASCVDFVEECAKAWTCMPKTERAGYKGRWLIYDADGRADFAESVKLARKYGFDVAFSNMCIEYWFMLHFYDHDGSPIRMWGNSHSMAQIRRINEYITEYNKTSPIQVPLYDSGSKSIEEDLFEMMLAVAPRYKKRRIELAYDRAKGIHVYKKSNGAEFLESVTSIYQLLEALGVIEITVEEPHLYCK